MTSQKQIEANQRNAKMSSGPKTEKGKASSKRNALKHGLRSREILTPDEGPNDLEEFRQQLKADLDPVGRLETELVEQIAACLWRLRRCRRIEAGLLLGGGKTIPRILDMDLQAHLDALRPKDEENLDENLECPSSEKLRQLGA